LLFSVGFTVAHWYCNIELGHEQIIQQVSKETEDLKGDRGKRSPDKNLSIGQALVAHACNPSYSGGRDQEDHSSKPA
jgi:hypothetical protein